VYAFGTRLMQIINN